MRPRKREISKRYRDKMNIEIKRTLLTKRLDFYPALFVTYDVLTYADRNNRQPNEHKASLKF